MKFSLPMAYSAWVLNYGFLQFENAYDAAGQTKGMCDSQKWVLEYFLDCWNPSSQELVAMVRPNLKYMYDDGYFKGFYKPLRAMILQRFFLFFMYRIIFTNITGK